MNFSPSPIIITGAAGFIGAALSEKLLLKGEKIIGIDSINSYYDVKLKYHRLKNIEKLSNKQNLGNWEFIKLDITDFQNLDAVFKKIKPKTVVNLAAQAGVRYSIDNPFAYVQSNLVGFLNILECCRNNNIENFIYASSSSVYGANTKMPFNENDSVNHPISFYAATKRSNELMAHTYSHLYNIPSTGLRFFTVYGPWGRPDMAPMIFANAILSEKKIDVFNFGEMQRDFTYISDTVEGITRCCYKPATVNVNFQTDIPEPSTSFAPHRIFNMGNSQPIQLLKFIEVLENAFDKKCIKNFKPVQDGDVISTFSDTKEFEKWIQFKPSTSINEGVANFAGWYKYYINEVT